MNMAQPNFPLSLLSTGSNQLELSSNNLPDASCSHPCASLIKKYNLLPDKKQWRTVAEKVWHHADHASLTQWSIDHQAQWPNNRKW